DLYAWTWTIWIILSKFFKKVYSVELVKEASLDWEKNAKLNNISNVEFVNKKVEDFLVDFENPVVDLLVIDPPRDWMHPSALPNIIKFKAKQMIYVSCNPSTLARDLDFIVKNSDYKITNVIPVDMFPHTHHIETVVKLELN
ncbi:MAG: 23S rRNA m(5)u-1939 methyltransferase, partial [uncultured bacterium (gcode 4)]